MVVLPSPSREKAVPAEGSGTKPTVRFPLPAAPGKGAQPRLSLAAVGTPGGWAFSSKTGVEQQLGSVTGMLETSFCLRKYRNLSDQGMGGETFYLCISAKADEKVRFLLVAEASIEVFVKDFSLQSKEELAYFTDFYCYSCLGQRRKEAWSLTSSPTDTKALTMGILRTNLYFYWNTFRLLDEGRGTSGKSCASK